MKISKLIFFGFLLLSNFAFSQLFGDKIALPNRIDSLFGSNTQYRNWWDVQKYEINISPNIENKSIENGLVKIFFRLESLPENRVMQIDFQDPMKVDSMSFHFIERNGIQEYKIPKQDYKKEGDFYFINTQNYERLFEMSHKYETSIELYIYFSGNPKIAKKAPWDGGWVFSKDEKNRPFVSAAVQGIGASNWFPCKDYLGDEPDNGMKINIITQDDLIAVSNGRLLSKKSINGNTKYEWEVKNPINTYNIVPYIGNYKRISDSIIGLGGRLPLDYYVLDYNEERAKKHFKQVKPMIHCFEKWFGPYPFYEDGFKLVDAPFLGMEHQSAIAYGNEYKNGYKGYDQSRTGWGLKWDYILIHESGHEWFGNSISTKDNADLWIHESFTTYSEVIFTECNSGKKAAEEYVIGTRRGIRNDKPIIGKYGVNIEGSSDVYYKGSNTIHTLRNWINNDSIFKSVLIGMNKKFYHKTITGKQLINYLSEKTGKKLDVFFKQYFNTTKIPVLEYQIKKNKLYYRWTNVETGFNLELKTSNTNNWIKPSEQWEKIKWRSKTFSIDPNFYIEAKKVNLKKLKLR